MGKIRILVVDNYVPLLDSMKRMLEDEGYAVVTTDSGPKALTLLGTALESYHLVMSDFSMPEMTGAELVQKVRSDYPGTKTILMSTYRESDLPAGVADAFVDKSKRADILAAIHRLTSG